MRDHSWFRWVDDDSGTAERPSTERVRAVSDAVGCRRVAAAAALANGGKARAVKALYMELEDMNIMQRGKCVSICISRRHAGGADTQEVRDEATSVGHGDGGGK